MPCGLRLDPEDCTVKHWCGPLDGRREWHQDSGTWRWRADCPVCHAERSLWYWPTRTCVRWHRYCPCDEEKVRRRLAELVRGCVDARYRGRHRIERDELIALALAEMPPQSRQLGMLELAGMSTSEALDKLGIGRTHRRRVIDGLRRRLPISVHRRRSRRLPISVTQPDW